MYAIRRSSVNSPSCANITPSRFHHLFQNNPSGPIRSSWVSPHSLPHPPLSRLFCCGQCLCKWHLLCVAFRFCLYRFIRCSPRSACVAVTSGRLLFRSKYRLGAAAADQHSLRRLQASWPRGGDAAVDTGGPGPVPPSVCTGLLPVQLLGAPSV